MSRLNEETLNILLVFTPIKYSNSALMASVFQWYYS